MHRASGYPTTATPATSAATDDSMLIKILAFARVRELLGFGERTMQIAAGSTASSAWELCVSGNQELAALRASTRFALNGRIVTAATTLSEGDELAFFPPVGGG